MIIVGVPESELDKLRALCIRNNILLDEEPSSYDLSEALNKAEDREWDSSTDWDSSSY